MKNHLFDIGDTVWYIENNKVNQSKVTGVFKDNNGVYSYSFCSTNKREANFYYEEDKLFASKKELIDSL